MAGDSCCLNKEGAQGMDARGLVEGLYPGATVRELGAGINQVFRVSESEDLTSIVKVYPVASRERRERHALEALAGVQVSGEQSSCSRR